MSLFGRWKNEIMKRILVVDDEKELAEIVAEQLSNSGYITGVAFDGVEAILSILDHDWDIVLLDIRMPKLDGINALRIIRRIAPELAVINFTGQAANADMVEAIKLGAYACLLKPIRLEEVLKAIVMVPEKNDL
jgi:two-component system, NtrC family, response regulator AtoC